MHITSRAPFTLALGRVGQGSSRVAALSLLTSDNHDTQIPEKKESLQVTPSSVFITWQVPFFRVALKRKAAQGVSRPPTRLQPCRVECESPRCPQPDRPPPGQKLDPHPVTASAKNWECSSSPKSYSCCSTCWAYILCVHCSETFLQWDLCLSIPMELESRLPGEISIISDMQMTPHLWQKVKRN